MLFQDRVWVWCITSATKIIELISFQKQEVQNNTLTNYCTIFFFNSSDEGGEYKFFQQYGATAHTGNNLMATLCNISED